ncbi:hypothetical protein PENARI_c002G03458 [Penicillium arizonense]|uniref:Uncharacterized protein n=1 Tax=Penicillium arizonense TaxID=1835702 RepID=A0A1F5LUD5_PENAI|nr:hypothetical protein PENARI_c002G03458 [Penicillium arizonense]OGE56805.1 hypothetical protein PENARI_c002G03458 [Penicillium arizonense]
MSSEASSAVDSGPIFVFLYREIRAYDTKLHYFDISEANSFNRRPFAVSRSILQDHSRLLRFEQSEDAAPQ